MSSAEYSRKHRLRQKTKGLCIDCKRPSAPYLRCVTHRRALAAKRSGYNMTPEHYEQLSSDQLDKCAICGETKPLHVDHDHESGRVRGLLCGPCNRAIGLMKEDPVRLAAAIEYLKVSWLEEILGA